MNTYIREPMNGLTHLTGAILSFAGLLAMVIKAASIQSSILHISALIIFGISMILLYSASATYHMIIAKDRTIAFFRKIDHSMIFILIAGSYAPFCLITLDGVLGWILFSIISLCALLGVVFKLVWFTCPRWISTGLYIAMGWMIIFAAKPLGDLLSSTGLFLLILGGVLYTVGGVIYALKPKWLSFKFMGFHEIFHVFIMLGTLAHFLCVYIYVI